MSALRQFAWRVVVVVARIIGFFLEPILMYLLLWLLWPLLVYIFRVKNRMVVIRKPGQRLHGKLLMTTNHHSLMDSFATGFALCYPDILWKPWLMPWQLADAQNSVFLRPLYRIIRIIPVEKNKEGKRKDHSAFQRAVDILRHGGNVNVFLEGTRSPTGVLLHPLPQVAAMALKSGATIRPAYHGGMLMVKPYRKIPGDGEPTWIRKRFGPMIEWLFDIRTGNTVYVAVGYDIAPGEVSILAGDNPEGRYPRLAHAIMDRIAEQERIALPLVNFRNAP